MTAYTQKQQSLSRTPCTLAVMTLDFCALTYGAGACTASGAAGSECYNTYSTCQDRNNFSLSEKDYRFSSHNAPLPFSDGERPYIMAVEHLSTEIRDSETVRGRITLELTDEPDTDVGIDPYVSTRVSVQGTFFKKLLARNPNYKGRKIVLYEGFCGLSQDEIMTTGRRFIGAIDNIVLSRGLVRIEAADLLKQLDSVDIPEKVNVKLALDADESVAWMTLSGNGVANLADTGYLRLDDEIIYYGLINKNSGVIRSVLRAQFETVAEEHDEGAKVQPVKHYSVANPFDMMQSVLSDAGVDPADVDSDAFDTEKNFVSDLNIEAVISEPASAKDLYFELVDLMNCKSWVSENLQITIARILPNHPQRVYHTITDDLNIIFDSAAVDLNQESLITRCSIYWDPEAAEAERNENTYRRLTIAVDADAEGAAEYNTVAEKIIKSRWLRHSTTGSTEEEKDNWIASLAGRNVWQARNPAPVITLNVEIKDGSILTGQYLTLTTDELQDVDGNSLTEASFQVISREQIDAGRIKLKCLRLTQQRIGYFAPEAAPDFDDATDAQREAYGYFTLESGKMSNADLTDGYVFF